MANNTSKTIEFKRILRQYEYNLEDLNDLKDLESHIKGEFGRALASMERGDLFDQAPQIPKENEVETIIPETERDPDFKKLFRKVVVKCHPDKLSDELTILQKAEKKDLYEKAIKANDDYNWGMLIIVAIKLGLDLPEEYYQYVDNLKEESNKVQHEIENIQGSVAWTWYHAENETARKFIMDAYIKHIEEQKYKNVKEHKLILGVGHPRTGTGYTSNLLKEWGLDVGHEIMGEDGIVAWQLASHIEPRVYMENFNASKYIYKYTIYNVRNPLNSIPSIIFTEQNTKGYRFKTTRSSFSMNEVEDAILSILGWDELILKMNPDFTYRIEDQKEDLYNFLKSNDIKLSELKDSDARNARPHEGIESLKDKLESVNPELKNRINEYCERYGYPKMF